MRPLPRWRPFYLTAAGLAAYRHTGSGPTEEVFFPSGESGCQAFAAFLRAHCRASFVILADLAEESFEIEQLPHVFGRDRRELIERKRAQICAGLPMAIVSSLGRTGAGRRDERFLFAGLGGQACLEPWLACLREAEAPLLGIYSAAQVLAGLIARRRGRTGQVLAVTLSGAGLRHTLVVDGHLSFSRLSPAPDADPPAAAEFAAAELDRTRHYLAARHMIERERPLKVVMLGSIEHHRSGHGDGSDVADLEFEWLDTAADAGLRRPPDPPRFEALLIGQLARHKPAQQFAPPSERRFLRLRRLRHACLAVSLASPALGLMIAAINVVRLGDLDNAIRELGAEVEIGQRRHAHLRKTGTGDARDLDRLRLLTDRDAHFAKLDFGPEPLLSRLSHALNGAPWIELMRIEWRLIAAPGRPAESFAEITARTDLTPDGEARRRIEAFVAGLDGKSFRASLTRPSSADSSQWLQDGDGAQPESAFVFTMVHSS